MKVQEQDIYHGAALMQIVEHQSFKALNKADGKYGHYLVNTGTRLWMKYAAVDRSPWRFTFQPADLAGILKDRQLGGGLFAVLVCGHHSICCVPLNELELLINIQAGTQQWIRVESPDGKQMRVTGSLAAKPLLAAHSRFPSCIF